MSALAPKASPLASAEVTCIVPESFEPKPVIADLLRTRYCVPGSIFLVEGIDTIHTSHSKRWRAVRLLLGDGELCIQALLDTAMHGFADRGEIAFGSYVKLERFHLERTGISSDSVVEASAARGTKMTGSASRNREQAVYLVVEDLILVGWNNRLVDSVDNRHLESEHMSVQDDEEIGERTCTATEPPTNSEARRTLEEGEEEASDDPKGLQEPGDDANDEFKVVPVSRMHKPQNRNHPTLRTQSLEELQKAAPTSDFRVPQLSNNLLLINPLKLTKLRSIPNLPYKQNWSVNVLVVISALSDVEPSGLPPYRQRQARLTDPSTDKHVLLTVFLDPQQFSPVVGSVVLLLGVKNHRFDGGCLKKYVSDRPRVAGESWWFENPMQFAWCDVAGLQSWWRNK